MLTDAEILFPDRFAGHDIVVLRKFLGELQMSITRSRRVLQEASEALRLANFVLGQHDLLFASRDARGQQKKM
jgi:hypothetical protein